MTALPQQLAAITSWTRQPVRTAMTFNETLMRFPGHNQPM